ncbi:MAG: asparagine synthase (glutamine-hydrolyzing), partial [Acidobacteria bacterium]|nr:asparagine synthase (glutamine-hydrolyzing) [Acidobacteriota bacterium]
MSVIGGLVHLDGAAAGRHAVERMAARFGSRAPDGFSILCAGSASFVYGRLDVTPGAARESQPLADAPSGLVIVFDGRIDNRPEMLESLELDAHTSDAALALQAHLAWGDGATERLIGDFAFAIWDASRRRLVCARDTSGIRPLFYREGHGWIAWASAIDLLAACLDPMPAVNEGMAAEYLTGLVTDKRETLFRGIYRLPPAHQLIASGGATRTRCYWTPDPRQTIRYVRDEDYAAHFTELMRTAVAARLRTPACAGVMLSGGVDSSSVAGIAAELCGDRRVPSLGIEAFSISVPGPDDERPFFEMVTGMWKLPAHRITARLPQPGQFRDEIARDLEVQMFPHAPTVDPLRALVRDRGARVLLTGMGADDWLGASGSIYADLLGQRQFRAFIDRARADRRSEDFPGWRGV